MLQPFAVADATLDYYRRYVRSSFPLRDDLLDAQRESLIDQGLLWADTFISLSRPGSTGPLLAEMDDVLLAETLRLPWGFDRLYSHQHDAIRRLAASRSGGPANTLILSGTGSGKTEGFLIPVVDACLREPGPGVKALIIYPMNALANDQLNRLHRLLENAPGVTFGRYTGDTPERDEGDSRRPGRPLDLPDNFLWSRQAMRTTPPNILLTNYTQLEYLLLRGADAELFRYGPPKYLIVDEIHLFTGILGAEVANLLRRFRQHTGATPTEITMVGTSATAGSEEEQAELLEFARRFFGAPFDADAAISERPADFRAPGAIVPPSPSITDDDLGAAQTTEGLAALACKVLGLDLSASDELGVRLGEVIDTFRTVSVIERALDHPAPLTKAAEALAKLPEREGVDTDSLRREAEALLLLGAAALQESAGEPEPQPRFRPRLHQVVRSLAGLWRCLDPSCGALAPPGSGRCPACQLAMAVPIASCRTCGEAYWTNHAPGRSVEAIGKIERLSTVEPRRREPAVFLTSPDRLSIMIDSDEEGDSVEWIRVRACEVCGALAPEGHRPAHARSCTQQTTDGVPLLASTDDVHCPSCGDLGARNRPILLPLYGSTAASVAVLTQGLSDELRNREGDAGGRLLVFADSRQDAAQQAGFSDDRGARVAIRQLLTDVLRKEGRLDLSEAANKVAAAVTDDDTALRRWLIGESDRDFARISDPDYIPSQADEEAIRRQLQWEIALEVTERSRRRFSLEQEGVVVVDVGRLDELTEQVAKAWPDHPFGSTERLAAVIRATVDVLRYGRAVDFWMLKLTPRGLSRNHKVRIGDRGVTSTRGYAPTKWRNQAKQVDIRGWTSERGITRMTELISRVLQLDAALDANQHVEALASRLGAVGLLSSSKIESRTRQMIDHKRLVMTLRDDQALWQCDRCHAVRSDLLTALDGSPVCANWRCPGTPKPFEPKPERDFYRRQYLAPPRRLIVREHSGQIEGDERIALEQRFNDRSHPTVDALSCTPTLEVGVSLDDLNAVLLRNLPPTPANYAQRIGRAGRRTKVGLAVSHAGQGPHDSYYFDRPAELIAGPVRAPAISLDNEPLLRRHINSLVFETLGIDLPNRWVPPFENPDDPEPTVADKDGVLRESAIKPFADKLADPAVRATVEATVAGAFTSPEDPSPPAIATKVAADQVEDFVTELRAALNRWCERYRTVLAEFMALRKRLGVPTEREREYEARLFAELRGLAQPKGPEGQPLGFLGLVGFLPRYGFSGESVLLHTPFGDQPIVQSGAVGVTEFAPGNIVYARGRKLKVRALEPKPIPAADAAEYRRDNLLQTARRCDDCEYLTFDPLEKSCPSCGEDLVTQQTVGLTGVLGSGGAISSDDEYRVRADYDVAQMLGSSDGDPEILTIGGVTVRRWSGKEIVISNRGPRPDSGRAQGFDICLGCGYAVEAEDITGEEETDEEPEEQRGHLPRCPGAKDPQYIQRNVWLTARLRGDVMAITLPAAARQASFRGWRASLAEALKLGIQETMQAGRQDLDWFETYRQAPETLSALHDAQPDSLVIYDRMPGGTGYFPKLFADEGAGLKEAARVALERLQSCDCSDSCHRCLRDFWNQRLHPVLNRFEVMSVLRRIAEGVGVPAEDVENEKLESFLESEFYERMEAAGLPLPTLQVVREIGGHRIIRVDAEYADPDISIFLDGRAYHAFSVEKIQDDLAVRNELEAKGRKILEFTFDDVMERFDQVATTIETVLAAEVVPISGNPSDLPGIEVLNLDPSTKIGTIRVNPAAWVASKEAWESALHSSNQLRLAGWSLQRSGA